MWFVFVGGVIGVCVVVGGECVDVYGVFVVWVMLVCV